MVFRVVKILRDATAVSAGDGFEVPTNKKSFQATITGAGGPYSAQVDIEGSHNGVDWIEDELGSIVFTAAATGSANGIVVDCPWPFIRARVISIDAGATLNVTMAE